MKSESILSWPWTCILVDEEKLARFIISKGGWPYPNSRPGEKEGSGWFFEILAYKNTNDEAWIETDSRWGRV